MSGDVTTELDRRIADNLKTIAGSIASLDGVAVKRLNSIHEALKAQRASGLLTDEQYAKEAGGLLNAIMLVRSQCKK